MKDIERDPHLRAALRHAPDAGLSAPADISAQILAAAHRAAAERAPAPHPRRFFATPWRLGASGAFASVALAGVIGLLWRGEPAPGPAVERTAEVAPAAAPAPPAVVAPAPAPPPRHRPAAQDRQRAVAPAPAVVNEVASPAMSAPYPARSASPTSALAPAAEGVAAAAEAAADHTARAELSPALGRQQAAAPAAVMAVPRPEGPWMAALAEGPAVQWRVDGEARAPTSSWLYALAAQTQGRWQPAGSVPPTQGDNEVEWWRGGVMQGRLWLGAQRVLWCDAVQNRCEEAALAEDVTIALRKRLAR